METASNNLPTVEKLDQIVWDKEWNNEWMVFLGHLSLRRKWKCLVIEDKFEWKWKFFPLKCWDLLLMWKYQRIKVKVNVSEEMGFVACVQRRQLLSICLCEDNSLPFLFIIPWSVFIISFKNENIPAYWWKTHTPRITSEFSFLDKWSFFLPKFLALLPVPSSH